MKLNRLAKKILMFGIMVLSFTDCHDNFVDKTHTSKIREFTSLKNDWKLNELFNGIEKLIPNGRTKEDILDRTNWDRVYKIDDPQNDRMVYTVPMYVNKPLEFSNLIIAEISGEPQGMIITYNPKLDWLKSRSRNEGLKNFTGTLTFSSLEGETIASSEYLNGTRVLQSEDDKSGRAKYCETYVEVEWTVVSVPEWICNL